VRPENLVQTNDEPLILSLETTTRAGSIALTRGAHVLSTRTGEAQSNHSSDLLVNVRAVLNEASHEIEDVNLFAVTRGPGSFTGLRIGLATVKSFAATLERPAIGVPTLYAIALSAGVSERTLATLPAGRGEVFGQLLAVEGSGHVRPLKEPVHLPPQRLLESLDQERGLKLAGEGISLYADLIAQYALQAGITLIGAESDVKLVESVDKRWVLAPAYENLAVHVAAYARRIFRNGDGESAQELQAIYVRPSDAELNEQCLEQNKPAG
jgi:tRNA threonylcarbamoyladenosine biosynthesis protein TsaB